MYIMASLINAKFLRYVGTVFLDLFISDPLMDVMKLSSKSISDKLKGGGSYSKIVAENFPSILQSIVGFTTFNAYTNQTRFNWAYADKKLTYDQRISPFTMSLVVAVAACLYATFNKDSPDRNIKLMYAIVAIALLYGLNNFEMIDPTKDPEEEDENEKKSYIGIVVFIAFIIYGLVMPLMSKKVKGGVSGSGSKPPGLAGLGNFNLNDPMFASL